jgi:hypothetical protein
VNHWREEIKIIILSLLRKVKKRKYHQPAGRQVGGRKILFGVDTILNIKTQ